MSSAKPGPARSRTIDLALPLVVLTGAGISAESGVPTFRGAGGLWRGSRPEDLATPEAFTRDPERVWAWYRWRRRQLSACRPNAAHRTLVEIERTLASVADSGTDPPDPPPAGPDPDGSPPRFTLITQNVDGLHQRAGSRKPLRLHGSIWVDRCLRGGHRFDRRAEATLPRPGKMVPAAEAASPTAGTMIPAADPALPRCPACGGLLRPDVVWFGESLAPGVLRTAHAAAEGAQTMLVIGTSARVEPAASIPRTAAGHGARIVEFNTASTQLSRFADERRIGPAARELPRWWAAIRSGGGS